MLGSDEHRLGLESKARHLRAAARRARMRRAQARPARRASRSCRRRRERAPVAWWRRQSREGIAASCRIYPSTGAICDHRRGRDARSGPGRRREVRRSRGGGILAGGARYHRRRGGDDGAVRGARRTWWSTARRGPTSTAPSAMRRARLAVNGAGAGNVARAAVASGAWTIHVSSDYVFDGTKRSPYVESDDVGPVSAYGRSKLAGEREVAAAAPGATHDRALLMAVRRRRLRASRRPSCAWRASATS